MGESWRAVWTVVILFGAIFGYLAWSADPATPAIWFGRLLTTGMTLLAAALLAADSFRSDLETNYLRQWRLRTFHRDGLDFGLEFSRIDDKARLQILFQNQFERPCEARISIRPFLTAGNTLPSRATRLKFRCPGGAVGRASRLLPVPQSMQGKTHLFEIGATVEYDDGPGRRLRFRNGTLIRRDVDFESGFQRALSLGSLLIGSSYWNRQLVALRLPQDVVEDPFEAGKTEVRILWGPGDPPLEVERGKRPLDPDTPIGT